jgi:hypothetical protein
VASGVCLAAAPTVPWSRGPSVARSCLEILLFWKEVEQYKMLSFAEEEKQASFEKIFELYIADGALRQVNIANGKAIAAIKRANVELTKKKVTPDDDIFDDAQATAYNMMLQDLFPRFKETLHASAEATRRTSGGGQKTESHAESLTDVTSGTNPSAARSFMRFLKERHTEENLLFW